MTSRVLGERYGKVKVSSKTVWAAGTITNEQVGFWRDPVNDDELLKNQQKLLLHMHCWVTK